MKWQGLLAVMSLMHTSHAIMNATSVITREDGWTIYPCLQLDHRLPEMPTTLTGQWYVIEIIQHRQESRRQGYQGGDSCPKLTLYKPTSSEIRLTWHDRNGDAAYNFKMGDPENAGFWLAWTRQSGSMVNSQYQQFAGSVQVIEAEPSRMVLTFCSHNRSHYSILMVRNVTAPHDTSNIRQMLARFGLQEVSLTETCKDGNSASIRSLSYLALMFTSGLLLFFGLN